jgi:hypothetical protein
MIKNTERERERERENGGNMKGRNNSLTVELCATNNDSST